MIIRTSHTIRHGAERAIGRGGRRFFTRGISRFLARGISRLALAVGFAAAATLTLAGQSPVRTVQSRDSALAPPVGTGQITGVLLADDQTQQPVRHAWVTVTGVDFPTNKMAFTDDAGKWLVSDLAAGRYTVSAMKPSYVRVSYGAKRFDRPGTPVTLTAGQHVENLTMKIARGGVIAGTINDAHGRPLPNASVRVMQFRTRPTGERSLAPAVFPGGASSDVTDDRGAYRLFGLPAGDYVVAVTPRSFEPGDIRQMTATELDALERAVQQQASTVSGAPAAPASDATVGYVQVFFPGTTNSSSAVTVTLGTGEERTGVDIPIQLVHTARIEGTVTAPSGVPLADVQLMMLPAATAPGGLGTFSLNSVTPDADGKFSYPGVAPGQYTITARAADRSRGGGGAGPATGGGNAPMTLWAAADVNVNGQNLSGLSLNLQPGMTVSGRIAIEAKDADAPADLSRTRLSLSPASSGPGSRTIMVNVPGAQVDPSGKYSIPGVTPGTYRISASLSSPEANWTLKSVMVKGQDTLDFPFDVQPNQDVNDVVVTFTNQTQEVSGTLQDATGRPAPDFTIVVFPAGKNLWSATRRIKTTRPGTDGHFAIANLPSGDYRIAAVVDIAPGDANDPAFLETLIDASVAITLHDGEKKVQDFRIGGLTPARPFTKEF